MLEENSQESLEAARLIEIWNKWIDHLRKSDQLKIIVESEIVN